MRGQRYLVITAAYVVLLPILCLAQDQPRRGTPLSSETQSRSGQGTAGSRRTARQPAVSVLQLPEPSKSGGVGVEAALDKLQSSTAPTDEHLKLPEIGQLAWAAQGRVVSATGSSTPEVDERGLMKVHFVLPDGVYIYNPSSHSLQQISAGDVRAALSAGLLNQQNGPVGGCQIVLSGSLRDFSSRYGNRARNVMLLLTGQMSQDIRLQAISLNLTSIGVDNVDANAARRIGRLPNQLEPLCAILVGYPAGATPGPSPLPSPTTNARRVLIIAPQAGFQDAEFFETRRGLEFNSVQVLVASLRAGPITGMLGGVGQADIPLNQVRAADFSALVFVGGVGSAEFFNNRLVLTLVRDAASQRKVIAASGNAPAILAAANILGGSRVTGTLEVRDGLTSKGARYTGNPVERDGPLVTSMGPGPQIIPGFVQAILDALAGR